MDTLITTITNSFPSSKFCPIRRQFFFEGELARFEVREFIKKYANPLSLAAFSQNLPILINWKEGNENKVFCIEPDADSAIYALEELLSKPLEQEAKMSYKKLDEILPPIADPQWAETASGLNLPVWIFRRNDLTTLWANDVALGNQEKSKDDIIDKSGEALDKPEELDIIYDFLGRDGAMESHEFNGYRWKRREDGSIYRHEHRFVEHWQKVVWRDQEAHLGVVLSAEKL
jgi:hypothetical protein